MRISTATVAVLGENLKAVTDSLYTDKNCILQSCS